MLTVAMNGRVIDDSRETTLEALKAEWEGLAEDSGRANTMAIYYSSGRQIVWRDKMYGSVMTAWANDPRDAVSFQVLEMG